MTPLRRLTVAGVSAVLAAPLLGGCSPTMVGATAISRQGDHLVIAVPRCDDTALKVAGVRHLGPFPADTGEPRPIISDGRWTTDQDDDDVIIFDTSDPPLGWDTDKELRVLEDGTLYSAFGRGGTNESMGAVTFDRAELEALEEGRWLYNVGGDVDDAERPTTNDLKALRAIECRL